VHYTSGMFQLKIALRSLRRQPSFFAAAVGALALGIAAPTALFAVVQATMLRPLPYVGADDIYTVRTAMTDGRFSIGMVASEEISSMRRTTDRVTASSLVRRVDDILIADGREAREVVATGVTEGFFDLFGLPMAAGRAFQPSDHANRTVRSVVLSNELWRNGFGADPQIAGRTIQLANGPALVVGVAPDVFDAPADADLWFADFVGESISHMFDAYVRFTPDTTPEQVHAVLGPMWDSLAQKYPDQAKNRVFVFRPLLSALLGDLGPTTLISFAATALLLLLAMANVTNLLLARGATRAREMAVRIAIGARRSHLIRQLLSESTVIAVAAAAIGVPLAYAAIRVIVAVGGASIPRAEGLTFDPTVAVFAAVVMMLAGISVGVAPALIAAGTSVTSMANHGGRSGMTGVRTRRLLGILVVSEVALAIMLVAGAGRLLLSARNLLAVDPGFAAQGRLLVEALLPRMPYGADPARNRAWSSDITERLTPLGVTHVGMATTVPLGREWDSTTFTDIVGRPTEPRFRPNGRSRIVNPAFFGALDIQVIRGRPFSEGDRIDTDPVVIVNRTWASRFLPPDADPLRERLSGLFFRRVGDKFEPQTAAIIGVVEDVRYAGLDDLPEPAIYLVDAQRPPLRRNYILTTAGAQPELLIPQIRAVFQQMDPNVPIRFELMDEVVTRSLVWSRLGVFLMSTFGVISLLLAGTGVFGVLAFVGAQRHGEMVVRLSLGATPGHVFGLMLAQGTRVVAAGVVVGAGLAWWMGQLMAGYVYEVAAANPMVLGSSVAIVAVVGLGAALAPAYRASRIELGIGQQPDL